MYHPEVLQYIGATGIGGYEIRMIIFVRVKCVSVNGNQYFNVYVETTGIGGYEIRMIVCVSVICVSINGNPYFNVCHQLLIDYYLL